MMTKRKNSLGSVALLLLAALLLLLPSTLRAQENKEQENKEQENKEQQKKENKEQQNKLRENINAHDHLIPRRGGADKFESNKFSEHLFMSTMGGITYLLNSDSGNKSYGPRGTVAVGNWFTPVIGTRVTLDYGQWKSSAQTLQTVGIGIDYLMNLTTFASRYRKDRTCEILGIFGLSYQATLPRGDRELINTYGLHAGLQGKVNLSRNISLFVEPQLAVYPDRVDGQFAWKGYDLAAIAMFGITYRPGMFGDSQFVEGCFSGFAVGTGSTGNLLLNTEASLGKWIDPVNGLRISAGSSTAFVNETEIPGYAAEKKKEFNISMSVDYLCNLSNLLLAERNDRLFSILFVAGVGSYFPGSDSASKIIVNGRFGFQGNIQATKHCGLWLEPRINLYQDNEERLDGQKPLRASMGLMIGTTYNF